ncbi:hypothetical protein CQ14_11560 [Bradyrhizobium lablabi]|uniref:Uncharacterized protein n=1 Tax=Bradyrhizobium lablabi TaxID=722472 RepID=A0A0R3MLD0_9BRAD|nr:hypothetical protein [Bradyrhizobium lablabi]KRR20636.1 hypothetical protein CQ14_11560 [Bradyrhizobium lablabi]
MYRRANLSRVFVLVVALWLTAVSTGALARESGAADPWSEVHRIDGFQSRLSGAENETLERPRSGAPDLNRTNVALIEPMAPLLVGPLRKMERI